MSQYLMAINSSGSTPPQETGLTCNSWYGKMHLEMICGIMHGFPLWHQEELLDRSLAWYREHLPQARKCGKKRLQRSKMAENDRHGRSGLPFNIAPLLVWQQPRYLYAGNGISQKNPGVFERGTGELVKGNR